MVFFNKMEWKIVLMVLRLRVFHVTFFGVHVHLVLGHGVRYIFHFAWWFLLGRRKAATDALPNVIPM